MSDLVTVPSTSEIKNLVFSPNNQIEVIRSFLKISNENTTSFFPGFSFKEAIKSEEAFVPINMSQY